MLDVGMERNSDPVSENVKLAEHIQMDYPHIVDELAEWSIYLDSSLSVDNSYCVATNLLRCRNISLSSVHPSSLSIPLDDNKSSVCKENSLASFSRVNNLFSISWRKISEVMNKWFPLSPLLVSYAHSRENNCPWLLGYLSSESIQGQALCLVATHWLELMELPNRLQSLNSSSIKEFRQSSDITPFELLQSSSVITAHHESDVNQIVINHSSKITRKWYLSYVDPYPQWRMVSFVSYKPCELLGLDSSTGNSLPPFDNLYYLTAIGYSNGSIDIIDLSVDESEKPDLGQNIQRSRIFIPPPFTQSNCSPSSKKPLFPIVLLTFIDVSHILVGHFRGHVDLWHLDWKAKSFPGRMMMRIYPVEYCKSSLSSPLLSGVFDLSSNLLVLSSLPDIGVSKASKLMHRKLGITCFYVSKKAPYLIPTSSSLMSDTVPRGMNTFYGVCKDLSIQLLCTLFRRNRYLPIENHDAIMSMVLANFNGTSLPTLASLDSCKQLLLGSLHSSGSYSVWLVPSFELLFLIANPERSSSLSMVPSDQISGTHTKAFRIAWWSRPLESNESVNQDVQLSILHENGSIDLLDITKCGTEFYPKVTRKLEGLKLSTFPVFAVHSLLLCSPHANCPSEVVLLSSCLKPSPGNGVTSQDSSSKNQIFNHCVRCTRLKSTTYNGLFEHFLRIGKFQKALQLCTSSQENREVVYKQMWTKLSIEFWKLNNFKEFIHSTLDQIKIHPLWVIKQCIDYLPKCVPSNIDYSLLLSCMRLVLTYGLNMLQSSNVLHSKDDLWYETVQNRLLIYSTHINCVESIVQAELLLLSSNKSINLSLVCQQTSRPCIDNILEILYKFRTHSLLDIGFNYAYCQQFIALRILFEHFPRSVGLYRLVIASNLSETIDPNLYFKEIFSLPLNSFNQLDSVDDIQNCDDQNVNRIQSNFSVPLRLSWESLNNPLELVQIISRWLVERSMQIDCRSGLTNYALNLLSLGSTICEELIREKKVNEEVEKCLKSLRKVRRDFIELVQIIYSEHISPSTILNISNNIPNLIVQQFNDGIQTFQLNMKHFQHFNSKSILNYLLQLHLNLINSNTSYDTLSSVSSDHHLVAYVIYQLLPHLAEKCIPTDYDELIKYCLLCSANYIGLTGHIKLLETIKLRSFSNLCDNLPVNINELISGATNLDNNDYINILNPYRLISGLLYVLIEYKPNYKSDSFLQHESTISFTTYLNDATCLINAMLIYAQDSIALQNTNNIEEYKKLIKDIQLVSRFTSVLTELQSLVKSIEKRVGSSIINLPYNSIGYFYRCSYDTGYFCNMLNSWIQIFTRLTIVYEYELTDEIIDNTIRRKRIPETFVKELSDWLHQLHNSLSKGFKGYPSEVWLNTGLQYALFASGNEYFLELSRDFCLNFNEYDVNLEAITSNLCDSSDRLEKWGICLLNATRSYVNTSMPRRINLQFIFSYSLSNEIEDSNEYMARYCLNIIHTSSYIHQYWSESLQLKFQLEEYLLNSCVFINTLNSLLPLNKRLSNISPYKLRYLWSNNNNNNNKYLINELSNKRINLLMNIFYKLIGLFTKDNKSLYRLKDLENLFEINHIKQLAMNFLISIEQLKVCFIHSMFNYIKDNHNTELYPIEYLMNITLNYINDLMAISSNLCWLQCAYWAGYHQDQLYTWTYLHCLYHIKYNTYMNMDPMKLLNIEYYRLRLARYALAYCSNHEYLNDLNELLGICMLRVEWITLSIKLSNNNNTTTTDKQDFNISSILKQVEKLLFSIKDKEIKEKKMKKFQLLQPPFYSIFNDNLFTEFELNKSDSFGLIHHPGYNNEEYYLWFIFLSNWSKSSNYNNNNNNNTDILCNSNDLCSNLWSNMVMETLCRDTRLSISYAVIGSKFCQLLSFNQSNYIHQISSMLIPYIEILNNYEEFDIITYRIILLIIYYYIISIYKTNLNESTYSCGCYPLGKVICLKLYSFIISKEYDGKFSQLKQQLTHLLIIGLKNSLIKYLSIKFPMIIDLVYFYNDDKYREDVIYKLCCNHLLFGLQLCLYYNIPQLHGVFYRLKYLLDNEDCINEKIQLEIDYLIKWINKSLDRLKKLLQYSEENIYPFLLKLSSINLLFNILPNDCELYLFDGLEIQLHRKILKNLLKMKKIDIFFNHINYSELLKLLHESSLSKLHHEHPLFNYLQNEYDTNIVVKIVEQIHLNNNNNNNNNNNFTPLQIGDIYAIYGLRIFYNLLIYENYINTTDIEDLFQQIISEGSVNDICRFMNWLDELLYSTYSNRLSINQRRFILEKSEIFISRMKKNSVNSAWNNVEENLKLYTSNFEQVLYLINKILFPQGNDKTDEKHGNEIHFDKNKYSLPKEFYNRLITMKPNDQSSACEFLKDLITAVINNNNMLNNNDTMSICSIVSKNLEILGHLLPPCVKTLKIEKEVWINIIGDGLSSCFSILSSVFQVHFEMFTQNMLLDYQRETSSFINIQTQTIYPYLKKFLDLFINDNDKEQSEMMMMMITNNPYYFIDLEEFLAYFLIKPDIRRLFGIDLLKSYINTIDNNWQILKITNKLSIFYKMINYLKKSCIYSNILYNYLDEFNQFLFNNHNDPDDDLHKFQKCIIKFCNQTLTLSNHEKEFHMIKEEIEIFRSVIEITTLIVMDDIFPDKDDFLENLWIFWYEYCQQSGIIFIDNGIHNTQLLIYEWTKWCIPPIEYTKAGLKLLSKYFSIDNDSIKENLYPSTYVSGILSVGLLQYDIRILHTVLSLLSKMESIIQCLDTNVCCYFALNNPKLWLSLVNNTSIIMYSKVFNKIFNSLIHFLQYNKSVFSLKLGYILCILLCDEDMWLEAVKIYTVIHHLRPDTIPIEYLMRLVKDIQPPI